jgi:hypothetical protein
LHSNKYKIQDILLDYQGVQMGFHRGYSILPF